MRQSDFDFICEWCAAFLSERAGPTFTCFELYLDQCPILNHNSNPLVLRLRELQERQRRHIDLEELRLRRKDKSKEDQIR